MNLPIRVGCRLLILFGLFGLGVRCLDAQTDPDPAPLLRVAVDKLDPMKSMAERFTYLDLHHTQNFNEKGKSTADHTELLEVTYIADLQYARLLEDNGTPLKGEALAAETRRYDDAVRERRALDEKARAKIQRQMMKGSGVDLSLLPTQYKSAVVDHEAVDGRECLVVDSLPLEGAPQKRYRLWLDSSLSEILRMDFLQLADEGDVLKGGMGTKHWMYENGTPLVLSSHLDASVLAGGKKRVRVVVDHTYSRYRRFSATTKIVPVEDAVELVQPH